MKKLAALLLAALICCLGMPSVFAQDTAVDLDVPEYLQVTLKIIGGTVTVNGTEYSDGSILMLPYNQAIELTVKAQSGKHVETVLLDGTDVTAKLNGGKLSLDGLVRHAELTLTLAEGAESADTPGSSALPSSSAPGSTPTPNPANPDGTPPKTGDTGHPWLWMLLCAGSLSLGGLTLGVGKRREHEAEK